VTLRAAKSGLWRFRVREATARDLLGALAARRTLCRARRTTIPCLLIHAFHANLLPNYSPRPWRIVHTLITCS